MRKTALQHAIDKAGGKTALGRAIAQRMALRKPVSRVAIYEWGERVPAKYCLAIEAVTGVTRYELRPDIFGTAPENPSRAATMAA